tara:strand:- start:1165 stop:1464 length:300 start_codon:yes stop_codon:yes gene_type:complete
MSKTNLRDLQLTIAKEYIYLDVDEFVKQFEVPTKGENGEERVDINLPKFEFFKLLIDVLLSTVEETDEEIGVLGLKNTSTAFKVSLNTLIEYNILKKCK